MVSIRSAGNSMDYTVKKWSELISLHDLLGCGKIRDEDVDDELTSLAVRYLADIRKLGCRPDSDYMRDIVAQSADSLSVPQIRGVLNVLSGQVRRHRKRFWKSRDYRIDRDDGDENCVVCGGPLNDAVSSYRGCGKTCWERICYNWLGDLVASAAAQSADAARG